MAFAASTAPPKQRKATLARELGVTRQAIGDLVKRGILTEDKDGLIDVEMARLALANRVRPSAKTAQALHAPTPNEPSAPAPDTAANEQQANPTAVTSYHVAKTLNETAQARMNQLRLKEMQGELIQLKAVESVWAAAMAAMREHLLQVRARLSPLLAIESDPFQIEQMLESEHSQALAHMAGAKVSQSAPTK